MGNESKGSRSMAANGSATRDRVKVRFPSVLLTLLSIVQGLALTWRHIFRKKDTLQYPEQTRVFGERYRGVPALVTLYP